MTLVISKGLTLRRTWQPMDPDAAAYITAVEAADTAAGSPGGLEERTKIAIDNFVIGCKADGIWNAIKASCILAGARTLQGCLVPLVGTAPTNFNFVSGDYNRKTGLKGDGSTKHINSNRAASADPQNSKHVAVWVSTHHTRDATRVDLGDPTGNSDTQLLTGGSARFFRVNVNLNDASISDSTSAAGLWAARRFSPSQITGRYDRSNYLFSGNTSGSATTESTYIFSRNANYSDARLSFYSIGESLDLAFLDARVTDLMNALAAAIP